jgi:anti-sigma regulatory factor (Ser/Thr protein kinase)
MILEMLNHKSELQPKLVEIMQALADSGVTLSLRQDLELVLEELLLNGIHYGYPEGNTDIVTIEIKWDFGKWVQVIIEDNAAPFNPLQAEERPQDKVGGWGLPLIQALTDKISYAHQDGKNRIEILRAERSACS